MYKVGLTYQMDTHKNKALHHALHGCGNVRRASLMSLLTRGMAQQGVL